MQMEWEMRATRYGGVMTLLAWLVSHKVGCKVMSRNVGFCDIPTLCTKHHSLPFDVMTSSFCYTRREQCELKTGVEVIPAGLGSPTGRCKTIRKTCGRTRPSAHNNSTIRIITFPPISPNTRVVSPPGCLLQPKRRFE